jgi:hypothetical protein
MRLTPPATATWVIALAFGALGLLAHQRIFRIPGLGIEAFWLLMVGFVLLLIAPLVKGL